VEACTPSEIQREVPHSIQVKTLQVCFPCGPELVEVSDPLSGGVMLLCLPLLIGNSNDLVDVLLVSGCKYPARVEARQTLQARNPFPVEFLLAMTMKWGL